MNDGNRREAAVSLGAADGSHFPVPKHQNPIQEPSLARLGDLFTGGGSCSSPSGASFGGVSNTASAATEPEVVVPELSCSGRLVTAVPLPLLAPPLWELLDPPKRFG